MSGKWDKYGEPENSGENFFKLEPGESAVIEFLDVEDKTFPAKTFTGQNDDITVPSVTVLDQDGLEAKWDLLNKTAQNAFLKLRPEPNAKLFVANHGKPKGKNYILWTVRPARPTDAPGVAQDKPKAAPAPTPEPKKVESEPDF